ncbi:MAG TPA: hypothetical protein VMU29_14440 [Smithella sp.]|nr:hypothetical protein [Smithella sp.]
MPDKRKNDQQDVLLEELLREKAAVLSRAGHAVDDAIKQLKKIEKDIEEKMSLLTAIDPNDRVPEVLKKKQSIREDINSSIDQFNAVHQKAELQYYYLIVTREALGMRRHEKVREIYRIPAKKKKYGRFNGKFNG